MLLRHRPGFDRMSVPDTAPVSRLKISARQAQSRVWPSGLGDSYYKERIDLVLGSEI